MTVDAPLIVVEVISPSSRGVDTGRKLGGYMSLPSVRHYLVLDPVRCTVLRHARDEGGRIETLQLHGAGSVELDPPGLAFGVNELFVGL